MSKFKQYLEAVRNNESMDQSSSENDTYYYAPTSKGALDGLFSEKYDLMEKSLKEFQKVTPGFLKEYGKNIDEIQGEVSNRADGRDLWGKGYDFINHTSIKVFFRNIGKEVPKF